MFVIIDIDQRNARMETFQFFISQVHLQSNELQRA